jgi:hypothetical protein
VALGRVIGQDSSWSDVSEKVPRSSTTARRPTPPAEASEPVAAPTHVLLSRIDCGPSMLEEIEVDIQRVELLLGTNELLVEQHSWLHFVAVRLVDVWAASLTTRRLRDVVCDTTPFDGLAPIACAAAVPTFGRGHGVVLVGVRYFRSVRTVGLGGREA